MSRRKIVSDKIKHILFIVVGLGCGFLSYCWFGICQFVLSEAYHSRGTYEWEENKDFIPYAYIGIGVYFLLIFIVIFIMREKKKKLFTLLFSIFVGVIETYLYCKYLL